MRDAGDLEFVATAELGERIGEEGLELADFVFHCIVDQRNKSCGIETMLEMGWVTIRGEGVYLRNRG